ncbi:hypothetical protein M3J09_012876 [Ascochyta lentis]
MLTCSGGGSNKNKNNKRHENRRRGRVGDALLPSYRMARRGLQAGRLGATLGAPRPTRLSRMRCQSGLLLGAAPAARPGSDGQAHVVGRWPNSRLPHASRGGGPRGV